MGPVLVVLAAGIGSRFGGSKQLADVGPNGEAIVDYTVFDADRAGFGRVVLVIRSEIEALVRDHVGRVHPGLDVGYVAQDRYPAPPREKPWGTAQAVLCAEPLVAGRRFGVVNADDLYGPKAMAALHDGLVGAPEGEHVLVGYRLGETLPPRGGVSRACCDVDEHGYLRSIVECPLVERAFDGSLVAGQPVTEDTPVSMNCWGFSASVFGQLRPAWESFLADQPERSAGELLLPTVVNELIVRGKARVRVVPGGSGWVGITHPEDLPRVRAAVTALIERGVYPAELATAG